MKKLFKTILNFGVDETLLNETRRVKITNILNVIVIFFLLLAFSNYYLLKTDFALLPVISFLLIAVLSLLMSKMKRPLTSFILFSVNINLAIFFFNQYYPSDSGAYLFYYPLIVSIVLLNNKSVSQKSSLCHLFICIIFFLANLVFDLDFLRLEHLDSYQIKSLWYNNLVMSMALTAILSYLLIRLISGQNREIMEQNERLLNAKESVKSTLKEKEILLAELHHRVKNNLAIISGLLNLQGDATSNDEARQIISDSKNRILSMALVHRMLFENPTLKFIDLGRYASELILELFHSYNLEKHVSLHADYDQVVLPVSKSIPIGLILNEVVTNSIKYAFKANPRQKGAIAVSIKRVPGQRVIITVKDNGKGFPENYNFDHPSLSLGIFLIKTLTEQIDGEVRFSNDNGAKIELSFMPD